MEEGEEESWGVWWLTVFGRPGEVLPHVFAGAESGYPPETRHSHTRTPEVRRLFKIKHHRLFQMSYERDRKTTHVKRNSVLITLHKPEKKSVWTTVSRLRNTIPLCTVLTKGCPLKFNLLKFQSVSIDAFTLGVWAQTWTSSTLNLLIRANTTGMPGPPRKGGLGQRKVWKQQCPNNMAVHSSCTGWSRKPGKSGPLMSMDVVYTSGATHWTAVNTTNAS